MPGSVIKGWVEGLRILQKGAKARLYIPSTLAYGEQGAGADIQPNSNLLFDVEILDILTAEQAKAEEEAEQKRMQEMQRQAMDSMMKAQKQDTTGKK
jgi:FKBP-type peptidyl-prolyl cis-trans isomerase FklB